MGFSIPILRLLIGRRLFDFGRIFPTHAFALSARQLLRNKNTYEHEYALGRIRPRISSRTFSMDGDACTYCTGLPNNNFNSNVHGVEQNP